MYEYRIYNLLRDTIGSNLYDDQTNVKTRDDIDLLTISPIGRHIETTKQNRKLTSISVSIRGVDYSYWWNDSNISEDSFHAKIFEVRDVSTNSTSQSNWNNGSVVFIGYIQSKSVSYSEKTKISSFKVLSFEHILKENSNYSPRTIIEAETYSGISSVGNGSFKLTIPKTDKFGTAFVINSGDVLTMGLDSGEHRVMLDTVTTNATNLELTFPFISTTLKKHYTTNLTTFNNSFEVANEDWRTHLTAVQLNDGTSFQDTDPKESVRVVVHFHTGSVFNSFETKIKTISDDKTKITFESSPISNGQDIPFVIDKVETYRIIQQDFSSVKKVNVLGKSLYGYAPSGTKSYKVLEDLGGGNYDGILKALFSLTGSTEPHSIRLMSSMVKAFEIKTAIRNINVNRLIDFDNKPFDVVKKLQNTNDFYLDFEPIKDPSNSSKGGLKIVLSDRQSQNNNTGTQLSISNFFIKDFSRQQIKDQALYTIVKGVEINKPKDHNTVVGWFPSGNKSSSSVPKDNIQEIETYLIPSYTGEVFVGDGKGVINDTVLKSKAEYYQSQYGLPITMTVFGDFSTYLGEIIKVPYPSKDGGSVDFPMLVIGIELDITKNETKVNGLELTGNFQEIVVNNLEYNYYSNIDYDPLVLPQMFWDGFDSTLSDDKTIRVECTAVNGSNVDPFVGSFSVGNRGKITLLNQNNSTYDFKIELVDEVDGVNNPTQTEYFFITVSDLVVNVPLDNCTINVNLDDSQSGVNFKALEIKTFNNGEQPTSIKYRKNVSRSLTVSDLYIDLQLDDVDGGTLFYLDDSITLNPSGQTYIEWKVTWSNGEIKSGIYTIDENQLPELLYGYLQIEGVNDTCKLFTKFDDDSTYLLWTSNRTAFNVPDESGLVSSYSTSTTNPREGTVYASLNPDDTVYVVMYVVQNPLVGTDLVSSLTKSNPYFLSITNGQEVVAVRPTMSTSLRTHDLGVIYGKSILTIEDISLVSTIEYRVGSGSFPSGSWTSLTKSTVNSYQVFSELQVTLHTKKLSYIQYKITINASSEPIYLIDTFDKDNVPELITFALQETNPLELTVTYDVDDDTLGLYYYISETPLTATFLKGKSIGITANDWQIITNTFSQIGGTFIPNFSNFNITQDYGKEYNIYLLPTRNP